MKNVVFWDVIRTDVSEELSASIIRVIRIGELGNIVFVFLHSTRWLLVTANVSSSPNLVTLMMETLSSSETSVVTRATRRSYKTAFFIVTAART
jgi:hypothetical protein